MVEGADRRLRAEQRDLATIDEALQDEHVGALVGVPGAPLVEARQAEDRGEGEDREQQRRLANGRPPDPGCRGRGCRHEPPARATSTSVSGGALLPFALLVSNAAGGSVGSGLPATRSRARSMLTMS